MARNERQERDVVVGKSRQCQFSIRKIDALVGSKLLALRACLGDLYRDLVLARSTDDPANFAVVEPNVFPKPYIGKYLGQSDAIAGDCKYCPCSSRTGELPASSWMGNRSSRSPGLRMIGWEL